MYSSQGWMTSPGWSVGEVQMKSRQRKLKPEKKINLELHFGEKPFVPFEADILATEDFVRVHRSRPLSPEHGLMVAILEVALADYQRCWKVRDKKSMERFAEAQAWILEANSDWIGFSLSSIVVRHSVSNPTTCARDCFAGSEESA